MRIEIPVRPVVLVGAAMLLLTTAALTLVPASREALTPQPVAGRDVVDAQVIAATHGVQRGYVRATRQLEQVRRLTLAIPETQASAIERKARDELGGVRREALATIAGLIGLRGAQAEPYVLGIERELERGDLASEPGVLLAPQLFSVVRRSDELFGQVADRAVRELTGGGPSPSPRP
jgi:hypothetical protein